MRFKIRSLLALTTLVAVLTMPAYRYSLKVHEKWNATDDVAASPQGLTVKLPTFTVTTVTTVVSVPDGGTWLSNGVKRRDFYQLEMPQVQAATATPE